MGEWAPPAGTGRTEHFRDITSGSYQVTTRPRPGRLVVSRRRPQPAVRVQDTRTRSATARARPRPAPGHSQPSSGRVAVATAQHPPHVGAATRAGGGLAAAVLLTNSPGVPGCAAQAYGAGKAGGRHKAC